MIEGALERTEIKLNGEQMDCDSYRIGKSSAESNKFEMVICIEKGKPCYKVIIEVLSPKAEQIVLALEEELKRKIYPTRTPEEVTKRQLRIANGELLVDYVDIDEIIETFRKRYDAIINIKALDEK